MSRSIVAVVRCEDYEPDRVLDACRRAVGLAGGLDVEAGQRILLKPNLLLAAPPERAVTTHPAVVRAMALLTKEAGAEVWVGDSPGGVEWNVTDRALEVTGIGPAAEEAGATLKDFDAGDAEVIESPEGQVLRRFALAGPVREADAVFSLAKLKTHGQTLYTGAVKNMLGCVPGGGKIRVHQLAPKGRQLGAALVDIFAVVRPRFALIDGIVAMEGNGPNLGTPRPLGVIIASRDPVAADAVAAHIIGYTPRNIHIIRNADERGLGVGSLDRIEVAGDPLEDCVCRDFVRASNRVYEMLPEWVARLIGRAVRVDPAIVQTLCKRCGLCQRSCPADAIEGEGPFTVNKAKCIRCFCCHELCPHQAMTLRKSLMVRLYEWLTRNRRYE